MPYTRTDPTHAAGGTAETVTGTTYGMKFTPQSRISATSIWIYNLSATGTISFKLRIYRVSDQALIASLTAAKTVTGGTWHEFTLSSPVRLESGVQYVVATYAQSASFYLPSFISAGTSASHNHADSAAVNTVTVEPGKFSVAGDAYPSGGAASTNEYTMGIGFNYDPNVPPSTTLVAPSSGSTVDLAAGYNFQVIFNDANVGDTALSYAFRRKIVGAGAYEYWNAGTATWQVGEIFNAVAAGLDPGETLNIPFASGKWTNATSYNWSVNFKDQLGLAGSYPTDYTVTAGVAPTVVVTDPTGSVVNTSRPTVEWTHSDPQGYGQASFRVKIFSSAQYSAGGFDPETSAATWDSGVVASTTLREATPNVDLTDGTTYRAYVKTTSQTSGSSSAWSYSQFLMNLTAPSAPTHTATYSQSLGRVAIVITGTHSAVTYPNTTYTIERSQDNEVTWDVVKTGIEPDGSLQATYYDYLYPPNKTVKYRVFTVAEV